MCRYKRYWSRAVIRFSDLIAGFWYGRRGAWRAAIANASSVGNIRLAQHIPGLADMIYVYIAHRNNVGTLSEIHQIVMGTPLTRNDLLNTYAAIGESYNKK